MLRAIGNGTIWSLVGLCRAFQNKKQNVKGGCSLLSCIFMRYHSDFRVIFELIKGEQIYVKDLENIEKVWSICLLYSNIPTKVYFADVHPTVACCRATNYLDREARFVH